MSAKKSTKASKVSTKKSTEAPKESAPKAAEAPKDSAPKATEAPKVSEKKTTKAPKVSEKKTTGAPKITEKIGVEAPKAVAFIGCLLMMLEGILYLTTFPSTPIGQGLYIVTGVINIVVGALLFIMVKVVDLKFELPIPYKWWVILAMGAGVLAWNLINKTILTFTPFGTAYLLNVGGYLGGLVVALAGFIEWEIIPEKLNIPDSKFVLLVGAGMGILMSIMAINIFNLVVPIICIAVCALLILAIFDVAIPYEWWMILIAAGTIFMLMHIPSGIILLVGFLLYLVDK